MGTYKETRYRGRKIWSREVGPEDLTHRRLVERDIKRPSVLDFNGARLHGIEHNYVAQEVTGRATINRLDRWVFYVTEPGERQGSAIAPDESWDRPFAGNAINQLPEVPGRIPGVTHRYTYKPPGHRK